MSISVSFEQKAKLIIIQSALYFIEPEPLISQTLIDNGLLEAYADLLDHESILDYPKLVDEMAFCMSNIATERPELLIESEAFKLMCTLAGDNKSSIYGLNFNWMIA